MPTGYTDTIKDGITFKEFALRCVRGMAALNGHEGQTPRRQNN